MLSNHANAVSSRSNHSVALNQQVYRITDLFWDGTYRSLGTFLRALRRLSVQIEPHMQRYVSHGLASAKTPDKTTARSVKHIHLHLAFPSAFENFDILNPFPTNPSDIDALNRRLLVRSRDYYAVLYRAHPAANSIDGGSSPVWTRYILLITCTNTSIYLLPVRYYMHFPRISASPPSRVTSDAQTDPRAQA